MGELEGTVKSFSEKNGYGFIVVEGQQQDVKFGNRELGNNGPVTPGTVVRFQGVLLSDGRIQARDVAPSHGAKRGAEDFATMDPGAYTGFDDGAIRPTSAKKGKGAWGGF